AVDLQQGMATANADESDHRHINLRIGVNLGDVLVEGGDLYGDGVNVAVRLQTLAEPGGILIAGPIYDQIRNKVHAEFDDLGTRTFKNLTHPVRVYSIGESAGGEDRSSESRRGEPLTIPSRPSIAVLPFTNMSSDPEQ